MFGKTTLHEPTNLIVKTVFANFVKIFKKQMKSCLKITMLIKILFENIVKIINAQMILHDFTCLNAQFVYRSPPEIICKIG